MKVGDKVLTRAGALATVGATYSNAGVRYAHVRYALGTTENIAVKDLSVFSSDGELVCADKPKCAPGSKYDTDKPDWSLVQWRALDKYVRVLTFGAAKYDRDNWQKVPNLRHRYLAAALRHVAAYATGESKDKESGEHHLAHAICCLAFMLEDILTNEKEPQP